ncbi:MAG: CAP domain-containing protein [Alphaproteobacteria bacterium]|jgi:uncharacterized protein YkwD|nr:CAP domain-containing protein [Alphaproteobacteria bacterium]MDP6604300.1 CAP domain-containing protein [Rhodospirillales bacterium]|tara:strand:+ start:163 stop:1050 length:888 start_codon:yes stop_codon:yes gene_type:complete
MMRRTIILFIVAVLIAGPPALAENAPLQALKHINALRGQHGLKPIRIEARLTVAARSHAREMARRDFFDVRGADGSTFESRIRDAGYPYMRVALQMAAGYRSPAAVVAHWVEKEDSRKYLLDPDFVEAGLAYAAKAKGPGRSGLDHFWVLTLAEPTRAVRGDWQREIVHRINEFRAEYRLDPVRLNERLNIAAQAHADDMARRDYFDHVSPEGGTVGDRATTAGYTWRRILENLAAGHASPAEAVEGWKLSNDHRHAMLDRNVQEAGVGYTYLPEDGGRVRSVHYWALSLGRRLR